MKALLVSSILALALWAPTSNATTWAAETVDDPVAENGRCDVRTVASYGSYIYHWPSKYDQVFWPMIDEASLWYCPASGFIAFIGDFDTLTPEEIETIRDYLDRQPTALGVSPTLADKLKRLEAIYELRDKDDAFALSLLRVLAYYHENALGDLRTAARYRERALEGLMKALDQPDLPEMRRLEYLFVAAAYAQWLGRPEASAGWTRELEAELSRHGEDSDELADFSDYLAELKADLPLISPGVPLAPASAD